MEQPSEPRDAPVPGSASGPAPTPERVESAPDFPITDEQRRAAVNYLEGEIARGTMAPAEAERRKQLAAAATTVATLLAATVVDESPAPMVASRPAGRTNLLALLLGLVLAVFVLVTVVPRLV